MYSSPFHPSHLFSFTPVISIHVRSLNPGVLLIPVSPEEAAGGVVGGDGSGTVQPSKKHPPVAAVQLTHLNGLHGEVSPVHL